MKDFLKFRKMITPIIIPILFLIGVLVCVIVGIDQVKSGISYTQGAIRRPGMYPAGSGFGIEMIVMGIVWLFFGPIVLRIICEVLIILSDMNNRLTEIKKQLNPQQEPDD